MKKTTNKTKKPTNKKSHLINTKHLPSKPKSVKNTPAYYHCLAQTVQGKKITKACSDCKKNSQALAVLRQQEVTKIQNSWKQIGLSLSKLIPN